MQFLRSLGWSLSVASSIEEARIALQRDAYDFVILDAILDANNGVMDGQESLPANQARQIWRSSLGAHGARRQESYAKDARRRPSDQAGPGLSSASQSSHPSSLT